MAEQPKRRMVRNVLDEGKRMKIVALLSNGSSRRTAARIVGCARARSPTPPHATRSSPSSSPKRRATSGWE